MRHRQELSVPSSPSHYRVVIVGAGPAGLMLAHLLQRSGVDSIVLEKRSRGYVEQRLRAGVLEQGTVDLLRSTGVGARMDREGLVHEGLFLQFEGRRHRIVLSELTGGRGITVYGQHEIVKDLINARLAAGGEIVFDAEDVSLHEIDGERPRVRYRASDAWREISCDAVAGVRRLARGLAPGDPTRIAPALRAYVSVRLARYPRSRGALDT